MKKYLLVLVAASVGFLISCGNTTRESDEANTHTVAGSNAGNTNQANTIYRDSSDIRNATEPGGGTGNPSNKQDSTAH